MVIIAWDLTCECILTSCLRSNVSSKKIILSPLMVYFILAVMASNDECLVQQSDEFLERIRYLTFLLLPCRGPFWKVSTYIYFLTAFPSSGGTECFPFNYLTVFVCFYAINNNNIYIIYINYIYNVCTMVDMYCIPLPLLHTCRART